MAYIYRHIRIDKNEPFYIGIGQDKPKEEYFYKRAYTKWNRNQYWKNIINKTLYEIEIIEDDISVEEALKKEIWWIAFYGRADLGKGPLCNLTDGGEGKIGYLPSLETRKKMSTSIKKNLENKENHPAYNKRGKDNPNYGKKHPPRSEEAKRKCREASLGKITSKEVREKISKKLKGIKKTATHNEKNRIANSGENHGMFGKNLSEETKKLISIKAKNNQYAKGNKLTEEVKKKISEYSKGNQYAKGNKHTDEGKKKMSEASSRYWQKRKGLI